VFVSDGIRIADNEIIIKWKGNQIVKLIAGRGCPIGSAVHLGSVTVCPLLFHALAIFAYIFVWNHKENGHLEQKYADHSGRAVHGMNCLRPLEHWNRVFETHSRHSCLCAFILRLCCPVRR
jgi:hypothetical protein